VAKWLKQWRQCDTEALDQKMMREASRWWQMREVLSSSPSKTDSSVAG